MGKIASTSQVLTQPPPLWIIKFAEPDFGSDEFDEATITFYEDEDCATEVESEVYSGADLYALYGINGTSCTMSGDYDFYTVLHCSESSPAAVYYEVNARAVGKCSRHPRRRPALDG